MFHWENTNSIFAIYSVTHMTYCDVSHHILAMSLVNTSYIYCWYYLCSLSHELFCISKLSYLFYSYLAFSSILFLYCLSALPYLRNRYHYYCSLQLYYVLFQISLLLLLQFDLVWFGLVWFGLVWFVLVFLLQARKFFPVSLGPGLPFHPWAKNEETDWKLSCI